MADYSRFSGVTPRRVQQKDPADDRKARYAKRVAVGEWADRAGLIDFRIEAEHRQAADDDQARGRIRVAAIRGALATLSTELTNQTTINRWIKIGEALLEAEDAAAARGRVAVAIRFSGPPTEEVKREIRERKLTWNKFRQEWSGKCDPLWAEEFASKHGAAFELLERTPAGAEPPALQVVGE